MTSLFTALGKLTEYGVKIPVHAHSTTLQDVLKCYLPDQCETRCITPKSTHSQSFLFK